MDSRRDFLKGVLAGSAALGAAAVAPPACARETLSRPTDALGLLYDATLCIGCKACVAACKEANNNPPEFSTADKLWDTPLDTSGYTFNLIKMYRNGTMEAKDSEVTILFITFKPFSSLHKLTNWGNTSTKIASLFPLISLINFWAMYVPFSLIAKFLNSPFTMPLIMSSSCAVIFKLRNACTG